MDKKFGRKKRSMRTRHRIRENKVARLCIHRTLQHIYAQVIAPNGSQVLASASSLDKDVKVFLTTDAVKSDLSGKLSVAHAVGNIVAKRAIEAGISAVAFDRSGFKYHGRVKALADAAREGGLQF